MNRSNDITSRKRREMAPANAIAIAVKTYPKNRRYIRFWTFQQRLDDQKSGIATPHESGMMRDSVTNAREASDARRDNPPRAEIRRNEVLFFASPPSSSRVDSMIWMIWIIWIIWRNAKRERAHRTMIGIYCTMVRSLRAYRAR